MSELRRKVSERYREKDLKPVAYTEESPNYGFNNDLFKVLGIGLSLLILNLALILAFANSFASDYFINLFVKFPFINILVLGFILIVGRKLAIQNVEKQNIMGYFVTVVGIILLQFLYSVIGGSILTIYYSYYNFPSVYLVFGGCILITLVGSLLVMNTDINFYPLRTIIRLMVGIQLVLILLMIPSIVKSELLKVPVIFFLFLFIFDMIYQLWLATSNKRNSFTNGIMIYVAFTGFFVHLPLVFFDWHY